MLSLKAASSKETVSAWEIELKCHLLAFVFFAMTYCATCEPSSLFSTKNSSTIFSPLQSVFLTSTPNLAGVAYGQTLPLSPPEQTNMETAINSVNDRFLSQFGVYTGDHKPVTIRATQGLSSSSLKTNAPIVEATPASHTVWHPLQSENRNARQSTRGGGAAQNLQTSQFTRERSTIGTILSTAVKSSYMQDNTNSRTASEITSAFGNIEMSNTQTASPYSDISPTGSLPVIIAQTALLQSSFTLSKSARFSLTSEPELAQSISSSHEKFTDSVYRLTLNLHVASNMFSADDLSPGIARSKSTFLSHYSTGTAKQVQSVSSALPSKVIQTRRITPSSAAPQESSASSAVQQDSSSLSTTAAITKDSSSSIITAVPGDSSSFTSPTSLTSTAFKTYSKSASLRHHIHATTATTASSFATIIRFTSVQPSLPSSVTVQERPSLTCKVNNMACVCFNCDQARKTCCQDLIDLTNIQQGVKMTMADITVETFHQKVSNVSRVIAEEILDTCKSNSTRCLSSEKSSETTGLRKKRSPETDLLEDYSSSNSVKTKRESDSYIFIPQTLSSSVNKEALRPNINPSKSNISRINVIIYSMSSKSGLPHRVETTFYVTATSIINGTNLTRVLDGKSLIQILRDKKRMLENRLNITIDSFSASQSKPSEPTSLPFNTTLVPNPSPGRDNQQTSLSTPQVPTTAVASQSEEDDKEGVSQSTLILIVCAAIGGLVLLVVLLVFILTRFYRQRKGEFVPDKTYPNSHSKQNGEASVEDVENIASFIDPSAPRITDVPHKPTRSQSSAGGGGGAGGKKPKKPMGVKITYKPPKWD